MVLVFNEFEHKEMGSPPANPAAGGGVIPLMLRPGDGRGPNR